MVYGELPVSPPKNAKVSLETAHVKTAPPGKKRVRKAVSAPPHANREQAAITIQKIVRGVNARRHLQAEGKAVPFTNWRGFNPAHYTKKRVIGRGGFGTVYLAINNVTGEQVAIKDMEVGCAFGALSMFHTELKMLQKLDHPNIVKLKGYATTTPSVASLYLEYVAGGSLFNMLKLTASRMYESAIRRFMKQTVLGIEYLHSLDILHRDIKPHNVLVDTYGNCKVTDFGCCKIIQEKSTTTQHIAGTPQYMSPDAVYGKVSKGSDVWGIGATIVELATNRPPWETQSDAGNVALIFHIGIGNGKDGHRPDIPATLSQEGKDFLLACFAPLADDRPSCTELLKHPFLDEHHHVPDMEPLDRFTAGREATPEDMNNEMMTMISMMATTDWGKSSDAKHNSIFKNMMMHMTGKSEGQSWDHPPMGPGMGYSMESMKPGKELHGGSGMWSGLGHSQPQVPSSKPKSVQKKSSLKVPSSMGLSSSNSSGSVKKESIVQRQGKGAKGKGCGSI
eukprot:TRINITY_DN1593_c0_g1_i18.p1 TRINITY_DN1593_c0_g1~~TRINITY_DN1593_c0_g1_i18.p1  ORF type:complete len:519 (+),score=153.11 TRINITY_DN1593_c0_g1_i18:37-1557(+)